MYLSTKVNNRVYRYQCPPNCALLSCNTAYIAPIHITEVDLVWRRPPLDLEMIEGAAAVILR